MTLASHAAGQTRTCSSCGCHLKDHDDGRHGVGECLVCVDCPGWSEERELYDPAVDHDPLPGLAIRAAGTARPGGADARS